MIEKRRARSIAVAILACAILIATAVGCARPSAQPQIDALLQSGPVALTILHTNDVAGEIDPCG